MDLNTGITAMSFMPAASPDNMLMMEEAPKSPVTGVAPSPVLSAPMEVETLGVTGHHLSYPPFTSNSYNTTQPFVSIDMPPVEQERSEALLEFVKDEEKTQREVERKERAKVVIIGAGIAGLSAAKELEEDGRFDVVVLEARNRIGGRIHTLKLPERQDRDGGVIHSSHVDLGASYMHGCDSKHPVYRIAKELGIRSDPSSSAETYSEQKCVWLNHETGKPIGARRVAKAHMVMYSAAKRIVEKAVEKRDKGLPDFPISEIFEEAIGYGAKRHRIKSLDDLDKRIIHCAAKRAWQICADFTKLSTLQEASWHDEAKSDEKKEKMIEEERNKVKEEESIAALEGGRGEDLSPSGVEENTEKQLEMRPRSARVEKLKEAKEAAAQEIPTDHIVVDGYHDFLVKHLLGDSTDIQTNTVVKRVESLPGKCVVSTSDQKEYEADYVVVTLPVGVLKGKSEESRIHFHPSLSQEKTNAIGTFGMGSENKVVLRFDPRESFWPKNTPYFISTDDRFRFLNLEYYGKRGVLVVHGQPPFSWNWGGLDDATLISEIRSSLAAMLSLEGGTTPEPLDTHVTRWDTDAFSMGSYSYFSVDSTAETVHALASCEGLEGEKRIHFAGEACSIEGHQCVHGAYTTGIDAAMCIRERFRDGLDRGPPQDGYGAWIPPVSMVQCPVCKTWKELSVSPEELERISEDDDWTCSAVCKDKSTLKKERKRKKLAVKKRSSNGAVKKRGVVKQKKMMKLKVVGSKKAFEAFCKKEMQKLGMRQKLQEDLDLRNDNNKGVQKLKKFLKLVFQRFPEYQLWHCKRLDELCGPNLHSIKNIMLTHYRKANKGKSPQWRQGKKAQSFKPTRKPWDKEKGLGCSKCRYGRNGCSTCGYFP